MNRTEFFQLLELAELYAKDDAWATAAARLRTGAEMAATIHEERSGPDPEKSQLVAIT